jgi:hypothetical protein
MEQQKQKLRKQTKEKILKANELQLLAMIDQQDQELQPATPAGWLGMSRPRQAVTKKSLISQQLKNMAAIRGKSEVRRLAQFVQNPKLNQDNNKILQRMKELRDTSSENKTELSTLIRELQETYSASESELHKCQEIIRTLTDENRALSAAVTAAESEVHLCKSDIMFYETQNEELNTELSKRRLECLSEKNHSMDLKLLLDNAYKQKPAVNSKAVNQTLQKQNKEKSALIASLQEELNEAQALNKEHARTLQSRTKQLAQVKGSQAMYKMDNDTLLLQKNSTKGKLLSELAEITEQLDTERAQRKEEMELFKEHATNMATQFQDRIAELESELNTLHRQQARRHQSRN